MPLPAGYLEGHATERQPRNFPTSDRPQNPIVAYRKWNAPLAAGTTVFVNAGAGPNATSAGFARPGGPFKTASGGTVGGVSFGGTVPDGGMDCPRNVVITGTGSAVVSGFIYGADEYNRLISEAWNLAAAGTFTGKKAFARVDGVSVTAVADASGNTISVGRGNLLGLSARCALGGVAAAVKEAVDAVLVATGTLAAAAPTDATADPQGTYLPATAPNGAHNYEVWYLVNDLQL